MRKQIEEVDIFIGEGKEVVVGYPDKDNDIMVSFSLEEFKDFCKKHRIEVHSIKKFYTKNAKGEKRR